MRPEPLTGRVFPQEMSREADTQQLSALHDKHRTAKMTQTTIGIDISKAHLDAHDLNTGAHARFDNSTDGLRALKRWLDPTPPDRVVFEPTGPFHRRFETTFSGHLPLVKVNPLQARRFAQAHGTRAKTDAVDARMLAAMGRALELVPESAHRSQRARTQGVAHRPRRAGAGSDCADQPARDPDPRFDTAVDAGPHPGRSATPETRSVHASPRRHETQS